MITQKRIIIILTILVALIGMFILWLTLNETNTNKSTSSSVAPFQIKGLDNPSYSITTDTQRTITNTIKKYLTDAKIPTTNVVAEVRKDSYNRTAVNDGVRTTVLIDIPTVKRTYKASISNDSDGYVGLYVVCPNETELVYGKFECKDETQL